LLLRIGLAKDEIWPQQLTRTLTRKHRARKRWKLELLCGQETRATRKQWTEQEKNEQGIINGRRNHERAAIFGCWIMWRRIWPSHCTHTRLGAEKAEMAETKIGPRSRRCERTGASRNEQKKNERTKQWSGRQTSATSRRKISSNKLTSDRQKAETRAGEAKNENLHLKTYSTTEIQRNNFSIETQKDYNRSTKVTALSHSFDYWNLEIVYGTLLL
jgi:hypothetical protein